MEALTVYNPKKCFKNVKETIYLKVKRDVISAKDTVIRYLKKIGIEKELREIWAAITMGSSI
jgi:predicted metalloprotease